MSRLAKKPLIIPQGVKVAVKDSVVSIEGPRGKATQMILSPIKVEVKDKEVIVTRPSDSITDKMRQGTMFRLLYNWVEGVSKGFQKQLAIEGVGFKAEMKGQAIVLNVGFTHPVEVPVPQGITVKVGKPTEITIEGASKEGVGLFAARVRGVFEPEPYKGKGIRYLGEVVRRKAGKAVVK